METKPFSLQAPEAIAKDYGGNKQKIAQAMQMGVVDPTAGLLAGMFIDRMRSAQQGEQAGPPQTVAQQVFSPRPPSPPIGGAPPPGLGGLPVPDQMFNAQPGGVVPPQEPAPQPAFAGGGPVSGWSPGHGPMADGAVTPAWLLAAEQLRNTQPPLPGQQGIGVPPEIAARVNPPSAPRVSPPPAPSGNMPAFDDFYNAIVQQESGGRYGVANTEGSGAMGVGQVMPDTGRAIAKKLGIPWRPELMAGDGPEARAYQDTISRAAAREAYDYGVNAGDVGQAAGYYFAGPDKRGWGPKTRGYMTDVLARLGNSTAPEGNLHTSPTGNPMTFDEAMAAVNGTLAHPDPARQAADAYFAQLASPAEQKQRKKEDMWEALASFGANLAASQSPYFLQGVGQAAQQTMPAVTESRKTRRAEESAGIQGRAAIEGQRYGEDVDRTKLGLGLYNTGVDAEKVAATLANQREMGQLDRETQLKIAEMETSAREAVAVATQTGNKSDFETAVDAYTNVLAARQEQGVPIANVDGTRMGKPGVKLHPAELRQLAIQHVYSDMAMRSPANTSGAAAELAGRLNPTNSTSPQAGAGWGAMTVE